jgi:ATP-binding cassette subfamily B protein
LHPPQFFTILYKTSSNPHYTGTRAIGARKGVSLMKAKDPIARALWTNARKYLPLSAASFAIVLCSQGILLIPALIMQRVLDTLIPAGDVRGIIWNTVFFVLIPLLAAVGQAFYQYYSAVKGRAYGHDLNQRIIDRILSQPMSYHDKNPSGELAAQATRDTMGYVLLWTKDIPEMLASSLVALISLVLIFRLNVYVGLSQVLFVPLVLLPPKLVGKVVSRNAEAMFGTLAKIRALVQEAFRGVRYVKLMGLQDMLLQKYKHLFLSVSELFGRTAAAETLLGPIASQVLSSLFLGIGFVLGAMLIIRGSFTAGGLLAFVTLAPRMHAGLTNMLHTNIKYFKQVGEYRHLFEYLQLPGERTGGLTPDSFLAHSLAAENVSFSYEEDGKQVLKGFSLRLNRGQWLGIEGATGAGKTTALNLLLLLYPPTSGRIVLDGVDCAAIDRAWYLSHIAVVGQHPFLFTGTVRDNLRYASPQADDQAMWAALDEVLLGDLLRGTEQQLDLNAGEDGGLLSGGEKQRLSLAMALLSGRPLLVLDEATSNLDADTEAHIRAIIKKRADEGLTVLSISHRAAFHQQADQVVRVGGKA